MLAAWVPGDSITVTRNREYWNDAATRLDGVKYLQIPDESAEFSRYRAGDLHITAVVPRGQYDIVQRDYARELHVSPQLSTYYYGFALDRAPFKDAPGLRRALSLVIDREQLAKVVLRVGELPAHGWIPPGMHEYSSQSFDYAARPMADRIAEARRLYAAAGYSAAKPLRELRYNHPGWLSQHIRRFRCYQPGHHKKRSLSLPPPAQGEQSVLGQGEQSEQVWARSQPLSPWQLEPPLV